MTGVFQRELRQPPRQHVADTIDGGRGPSPDLRLNTNAGIEVVGSQRFACSGEAPLASAKRDHAALTLTTVVAVEHGNACRQRIEHRPL